MTFDYSIIIPLYNSNYIDIQIKSINSLELVNVWLEIIFIDDWSSAFYIRKYKQELKKIKNQISYKYFSLWEKKWRNRVCEARNYWVNKSLSKNIIFIDQDTILHKNYMIDLLNIKQDIVLGQSLWYNNFIKKITKIDIENFILNWSINKLWFDDFRKDFISKKELWTMFWASNLFITKEKFINIWWFDEKIINWGDEDVDFGYRLFKKWDKISFINDLKVLNLSEKLYNLPYNIIENSKIKNLTKNFIYNYNKHWKSRDYKEYILDRFYNFDFLWKKSIWTIFFEEILKTNFYKKNHKLIFFRLDDINKLNSNFKKLISILIYYKVPFVLWIEPKNIDKNIIEYIKKIKKQYWNLFDIAQHWYNHNSYSNWKFDYEFWKNRSYQEQKIDINNWLNIIEKKFWKQKLKIFIPPFNNINYNTEKILEELDFNIFSSWYPYKNYCWSNDIISIPWYVDIIKNYKQLTYKSKKELFTEVDFYLKRDWFANIILHPNLLDDDSFNLIVLLIQFLKIKKLNFSNFSQFYQEYKINEI